MQLTSPCVQLHNYLQLMEDKNIVIVIWNLFIKLIMLHRQHALGRTQLALLMFTLVVSVMWLRFCFSYVVLVMHGQLWNFFQDNVSLFSI